MFPHSNVHLGGRGERGREEGERGREEGMGGKALADKQGMGIAMQLETEIRHTLN